MHKPTTAAAESAAGLRSECASMLKGAACANKAFCESYTDHGGPRLEEGHGRLLSILRQVAARVVRHRLHRPENRTAIGSGVENLQCE